MDPAEMRRRVAAGRVARLSSLTPDGRLHLVPFCYALDGDTLYTEVDEKPKRSRKLQRIRNIEANPSVAVLVDHYEEDWERVWWVRLRGEGSVVDDAATVRHAQALLADKYEQYRREPPTGTVIAIRITEWRGWASQD